MPIEESDWAKDEAGNIRCRQTNTIALSQGEIMSINGTENSSRGDSGRPMRSEEQQQDGIFFGRETREEA